MKEPSMEFDPSREKSHQDFSDLAVVTTTKYDTDEASKVRASLAEQSFEQLEKLDIPTFSVDGGSEKSFVDSTQRFEHLHSVQNDKLSMGESRRESLRLALQESNAPFLLWTEPEKADLLKPETLQKLLLPLRNHEADIVIPKRITKESYPEFQAWIEKRGNKRLTELLKSGQLEEIDFWFGPRIFSRDMSDYFLKDEGEKWDSIFTPVVKAAKDGKRLVSVDVDFQYPIEQRSIEEANELLREFKQKRLEQYKYILSQLKHFENE